MNRNSRNSVAPGVGVGSGPRQSSFNVDPTQLGKKEYAQGVQHNTSNLQGSQLSEYEQINKQLKINDTLFMNKIKECEQLTETVKQQEKKINELNLVYQQIELMRTELIEIKSLYDSQKQQLLRMQAEDQFKMTEIQNLQVSVEQYDKQILANKQQFSQYENEKKKNLLLIADYENTVQQLKEQVQNQIAKYDSLQITSNNLLKESKNLQTKFDLICQEKDAILLELQNTQNGLQSQEMENVNLKNEKNKLQILKIDHANLQNLHDQALERQKQLDVQIEQFQQKNKEQQSQLAKCELELQKLRQINLDYQVLQKDFQNLSDQNNQLESKNKILLSKNKDQEYDIQRIQKDVVEFENLSIQFSVKTEDLTEQLNSLTILKQQLESNLKTLNQKNLDLEYEIREKNDKLETLMNSQDDHLQIECKHYKLYAQKIHDFNLQILNEQKRHMEFLNQTDENDTLKKEVSKLKSALHEIKQIPSKSSPDRYSDEQRIEKLNNDNAKLNQKIYALENQVIQLKEEIMLKEKTEAQLTTRCKKQEIQLKQQSIEFETKIEELQIQNEKLKKANFQVSKPSEHDIIIQELTGLKYDLKLKNEQIDLLSSRRSNSSLNFNQKSVNNLLEISKSQYPLDDLYSKLNALSQSKHIQKQSIKF